MTKQLPPRDDAELAARIEAATRPAPWTPHDRARFRAAVEARAEEQLRARAWWKWGLAASLAGGALAALLLVARVPEPAAPGAELAGASVDPFEESYEEQVLFAPEWIARDDGFVDDDVLPDSYALASHLIEP